MKSAFIVLAVLAMANQAFGQYIPPCVPSCGIPNPTIVAAPAPAIVAAPGPIVATTTPTVITTNSVAASLADTLSLLTVTSLLAETLPYSCPGVPQVAYPGCGCGYGYIM